MTQALYLPVAALSLGFAVAGLFLPVLPTTPFVLLASYCLVRSSPRLDARLRRAPLFGRVLDDWERQRGVRPGVKVAALASMGAMVALTVALGDLHVAIDALAIVLAVIGAFVVLRLRTLRGER